MVFLRQLSHRGQRLFEQHGASHRRGAVGLVAVERQQLQLACAEPVGRLCVEQESIGAVLAPEALHCRKDLNQAAVPRCIGADLPSHASQDLTDIGFRVAGVNVVRGGR